jgi:hypothetical protein
MNKWFIIVAFILFIFVLTFTNPTEEDYQQFIVNEFGEPPISDLPVEIERVDFVIFSTYTPIVAFEHGITHLGIGGIFLQISDGQFDYPWWLELFN